MAKQPPLTFRILVPDGQGGHRQLEELTQEERDAFSKSVVQRLGTHLNNYFGRNPDVYETVCRKYGGTPPV